MEIRRKPPNPKIRVENLEYSIPHKDSKARNILEEGPPAGMILNTANEIAVEAFLLRKIHFLEITYTVEKILEKMAKTFTCEIKSLADLHELHKDIHRQFSLL